MKISESRATQPAPPTARRSPRLCARVAGIFGAVVPLGAGRQAHVNGARPWCVVVAADGWNRSASAGLIDVFGPAGTGRPDARLPAAVVPRTLLPDDSGRPGWCEGGGTGRAGCPRSAGDRGASGRLVHCLVELLPGGGDAADGEGGEDIAAGDRGGAFVVPGHEADGGGKLPHPHRPRDHLRG